jgi:tRNA modification GTPase
LVNAEELRGALHALDAVAGRSGVEHVLDAVFARFCIGI